MKNRFFKFLSQFNGNVKAVITKQGDKNKFCSGMGSQAKKDFQKDNLATKLLSFRVKDCINLYTCQWKHLTISGNQIFL